MNPLRPTSRSFPMFRYSRDSMPAREKQNSDLLNNSHGPATAFAHIRVRLRIFRSGVARLCSYRSSPLSVSGRRRWLSEGATPVRSRLAMGIWNQYGLARQVGRESQRANFGGLLSSAYFSAARHDRHIFRCFPREASACCSSSSALGGWQLSGALGRALQTSAIFQRWWRTLLHSRRLPKGR